MIGLIRNILIIAITIRGCDFVSIATLQNAQYNSQPDRVIQGDIAKKITKSTAKNANIVSETYIKWTNGVIPFVINSNIPENFRQLIIHSMNLIQRQTKNCIKFEPYEPNVHVNHRAWLHILDSGGCWSWIGQGTGEQWLSLTWGCYYQSTIVHELLHTIGFWHEQSRPDRDNHITINWTNIYMENNGEFAKRDDTIDTQGIPYDYYSIMHYKFNTFAIDSNKPTIIPKDPYVNMYALGTRDDLSPLDVLKIWKYYDCNIY